MTEEFKLEEIAEVRPELKLADYAETLRVIDAGITQLRSNFEASLKQAEGEQTGLPIGGLEDDLKKLELTENTEKRIGELEAYYLEIQEEARERFGVIL
ncbi:MAG: hypothetical protein WCV72_02490 [Patescibacteria group bacterium]|jgi:hypothetical protein